MTLDGCLGGYENVELGAQAYDIKRRLGGKAFGTKYHFEVRSPWLSVITNFVAKNFSSQKGSEISSESRSCHNVQAS